MCASKIEQAPTWQKIRWGNDFVVINIYWSNTQEKKTLVLDLDRTIVYQTTDVPNKQTNFVEISDNVNMKSFVVKRPGLDIFMKEMSSLYNVCIYSEEKSEVISE